MMNEEIHPSNLNIIQQYRRHYEKIGTLTQHQLDNYEELEKFVSQILFHEAANHAKSLGIVTYLGDEMSIASLGPEHQNPGELGELRDMMMDSPKEVLEDKTVSIESHAWRLFPYAGAEVGNEFATAVAVSRKHENTLRALREIGEQMNLPIRTTALCAPLCAIASLPWFSSVDNNGTVAVINYQKFTLLGFFNKSYELMLLRYMPHSNGAKVPANIGPAVLATAAAFELENPVIQLLPVCGQDMEPAIVSLQSTMMGSEIMLVDIQEVMRNKNIPETVPLEVLTTTQQLDPEIYPLAANETFSSYESERWHTQDFLSPSNEELEMNPGQQDMKLLKLGRRMKMVAALLLGAVVLYSGFNVWNKMSSPEWLYKPKNSAATAAMLSKQIQQYDHWENLLKERSKAWVSMELLTRMVPEDGSVILSGVTHSVTQKPEQGAKKLGFQKEWVVKGLTNEAGLKHLSALSTREGVKKLFSDVAAATGNSAYLPDAGKRDITVTLKQKNNNRFNTVGSRSPGDTLKYSFTMVITQTFGGGDDMAIAGVKTVTIKR